MRNVLEQDEMRKFNLWKSFEQSGCTWDELERLCTESGLTERNGIRR